ncbi:DUF1254 domain-containing protein [Chelativorans alearense]|uniref:DUF1254 domain-containing protein n=1 Tax=Chelativorans alearense TaxID=2681495 RepID=UPI0013D439E0|nr:DUF1254 domain-containing protein [Chelativorans alearense]
MARLPYALLLGLVGAGIVHLAILFLLPSYSVRDAWSRLSAVAEPYDTVRFDREKLAQQVPIPADPFIEAAACRFDLSRGSLHVHGEGSVPFWSMSVYDHQGLNVYSISDRATPDGALDFTVLTQAQMQRMRTNVAADLGQSVFIETDVEEGIVLLRVFVPDETWEGAATAFLNGISCEPRPLG